MSRLLLTVGLAALLGIASPAAAQPRSEDSLVKVSLVPDRLEVGTFYRGATVKVTAEVARCDGAVLVLQAGEEKVALNRKGRVAGIWLNVAQVEAHNVPSVYILATTGKLASICSPAVQQKLGLGTAFLRNRITFTSDKPLTGSEFDQFLHLKTGSGAYNTEVKISLTSRGPDRELAAAALPIPATVPPGTYRVVLYCFRDGRLLQTGVAELTVERVGMARFMANLAQQRAAVYGVLAVLIAMVVGIAMGIIFNSSPGGGH